MNHMAHVLPRISSALEYLLRTAEQCYTEPHIMHVLAWGEAAHVLHPSDLQASHLHVAPDTACCCCLQRRSGPLLMTMLRRGDVQLKERPPLRAATWHRMAGQWPSRKKRCFPSTRQLVRKASAAPPAQRDHAPLPIASSFCPLCTPFWRLQQGGGAPGGPETNGSTVSAQPHSAGRCQTSLRRWRRSHQQRLEAGHRRASAAGCSSSSSRSCHCARGKRAAPSPEDTLRSPKV